ncbi:MAG: HYC_CC_PP family protein [Flavobacteriales bacterium]
MKRWLGIIIVALYGLLSTGLHVHMHYCHGKLKHVAVASQADECCKADHQCGSLDGIHASCCDNENITFELESDHTSGAFKSFEFIAIDNVEIFKSPTITTSIDEDSFVPSIESRPPPNRPIFLLNQSLVFYA